MKKEFNTIKKIVEQLKKSEFIDKIGIKLKNNLAFEVLNTISKITPYNPTVINQEENLYDKDSLETIIELRKEIIQELKDLNTEDSVKLDLINENLIKLASSQPDSRIHTDKGFYYLSSKPKLVIDKEKLPKEYFKEKVTLEPDKKAIKEALKSSEISGAKFEINQFLAFKDNTKKLSK